MSVSVRFFSYMSNLFQESLFESSCGRSIPGPVNINEEGCLPTLATFFTYLLTTIGGKSASTASSLGQTQKVEILVTGPLRPAIVTIPFQMATHLGGDKDCHGLGKCRI